MCKKDFPQKIASVKIGGEYYPIGAKGLTVGNIKISVCFENKAEDLYSWVINVLNDSEENSPRITELMGMDLDLAVTDEVKFNTLRGDDCTIYSFYPETFELNDGTSVERAPFGARPSNTSAFPYFDIVDSKGEGLVCGIGWSGQWKLSVTRNADSVNMKAGFQDCDFYLLPHEKVRSVRALVYIGKGGVNKLRQNFVKLHREFYSFAEPDKAFFPVSASCFDRYYWGNLPQINETVFFETEGAQLAIIENAAKCEYVNSFWLDACWFDGAFRTGVGNYKYAEGFKNGLKSISDLAHKNDMKFILWFEPARAMPGTDVYEKFKDDKRKIISLPNAQRRLVNLGDEEVLNYQLENISKIIKDNGVDIYRQDFNIDPYSYLRSIEEEDRVGIAQIRFTEGIYKLWDGLKERFPGLFIDNCASGGRLIDVETNMRAIPLWQSDMSCRPSPLATQNENICLSRYIPYHQGGTFDYTAYFMRSAMTTGFACAFGFLSGIIDSQAEKNSMEAISNEAFKASEVVNFGVSDVETIKKSMKEALSLREYWLGDFTAITPPSDSKEDIVAYALKIREENKSVALVFRREDAPDNFILNLPDIDIDKEYKLTFSDEDFVREEAKIKGAELTKGLKVKFTKAPASLLLFYNEI